MKQLVVITALMLFCAALVTPARADTFTLTDNNSTVVLDSASQIGAYQWIVDGHDMLYQQWFWYRVGTTGPEQSIDTLPGVFTQLDATHLSLTYTLAGAFEIEIDYTLTGGLPGSHTSDIAESIAIHNLGNTALDMHFFQYSDFDINANLVDQVMLANANLVQQWDVAGLYALSETIIIPGASGCDLNYFANTLNSLNDGAPTNFGACTPGMTAGPGDVTWAFQWDRNINPGGSFIISKDKLIEPVPEPGSLALLGSAILGLGALLRRKL